MDASMPYMTLEQACEMAAGQLKAGKLGDAEASYRQLLAQQPNEPRVLGPLARLLFETGRKEESAQLLRRAAAIQPDSAEAHSNLGMVLATMGKLDEAIVSLRRAVALRPGTPEVCNNLGNALQAIGRFDEAIAAYRAALASRPTYAEAHSNLGNALKEKGQMDEAIASFQQAAELRPQTPELWHNLGNALEAAGRSDEARAACDKAIDLKRRQCNELNNLGVSMQESGKLMEALTVFGNALAAYPDFPEVHNNLGIIHQELGKSDEAIAAYQQALALKGDFAEVHNNLGNAFKDTGQLDEALACYRKAAALKTDNWAAPQNVLYTQFFLPDADPASIWEEHDRWNQTHGRPLASSIRPHENDRNSDRRLRLGYVSPDFNKHPVGRFLLPLLANRDREGFEVFCYCDVKRPDSMTDELRGHAGVWRDVTKLSDEQLAEQIRADGIDILVDLAMHTMGNRMMVFARKPAPVQATYLAYCGTTGLETVDYRLTDSYMDPPTGSGQDDRYYSERSIRLQSYFCYEPLPDRPEVGPVPSLARGRITFGCLNNFAKVTRPTLETWAELLRQLPTSVLSVHSREGAHRQRAVQVLMNCGIDPGCLEFVGVMPGEDYFRRYHEIDVALDPFPFPGGTTTCDALWMGVPVVSLAGKTAVSRAGLSILSNIELPELVADTRERYVQIARDLATDPTRLAQLRSTLRQRMRGSPLMDAPGRAREIEAAYRKMWRTWCTA